MQNNSTYWIKCFYTSRPWFWQAALIVTAVMALRLPTLSLSVIDWDETIYALVAREMLAGHLPYEKVFDHKPIALYYHFAAVMALFGDHPAATRALSLLLVVGAALLVRHLLTRYVGLPTITATLIALGYAIACSGLGGAASNSEHVINFYTLAWLAMVLKGWQHGARYYLFAGILMGVSFQSNYLTGAMLVGFSIGFFLYALRETSTWLTAILRYVLAGLTIFSGFLLANLLLLLPLLLWGDITQYFTLQYQFLTTYAPDHGAWQRLTATIPWFLPLMVLATGLLFHYLRHPLHTTLASTHYSTLLALVIPILLGCWAATSMSGRFYPHYFIFLYPGLFVMLGILLRMAPLSRHAMIAALVVFLGGSALLGSHGIHHSVRGLKTFYHELVGKPMRYDTPRMVAQRAIMYLQPGEAVYVVCAQPVLYQLLDVTPPTRFAFFIHHFHRAYTDGFGFEVMEEVRRILSQSPKLVITKDFKACKADADRKDWDALHQELELRGYQPVETLHGHTLYQQRMLAFNAPQVAEN